MTKLIDGEFEGPEVEVAWYLRQAKDWRLKICWSPKKCRLSGKDLWLKQAYQGTGPATFYKKGVPDEKFWVDRDEFVMWNLRGQP